MSRLRRRTFWLCYALAGGGLLWSGLVALSGGVSFEVYGIPLSSREPVRPLVIALASGILGLLIQFGPRARVSPTVLARASALGAAVTAGIVLWLAVDRGSFVAGGADSSSYLSQAVLWQQGLPRVSQPLALQVPWPEADATLSPLGFCPCAKPDELVPIHPAGYPLSMAATRALMGPGAEFWVVPTMAAGLILCTYLLGAMVWRGSVGFLAAALLATSPTFLFQALQPMGDVPAAFWWTLALTLGLRRRTAWVAVASAATAVAVVTRPNLAPVGLVLATLLFFIRRSLPAVSVHRFAWTGVLSGTAAGWLIVAVLNQLLYASPLNSGYGNLAELYSAANVLPNASRYLSWLAAAETPLFVVLLVSPAVAAESPAARRVRWYGLALGVLVLGSYLPWLVFESWTFLRFLLVAFPLLYLLLVSGAVVSRLPSGWVRRSLPIVVFAAVGIAHAQALVTRDVFEVATFEARYRTVGEYVDRMLPRNAVVLSMQHSGSVRYYSGRQILRYNYLDPAWLEGAVRFFQERGAPCYAVLEEWEVARFRDRFQAAGPLGRLDWRPLTVIDGVSVYELPRYFSRGSSR